MLNRVTFLLVLGLVILISGLAARLQAGSGAALVASPDKPTNLFVKDMNGKDYFPLGVNYAWKDWGRDFSANGWEERFQTIQADLDKMKARGVRTLRWWIFTDFVESPLWEGKGKGLRCTGLPKDWVLNFLKVADAANQRGIRLYPVFSSFDLGRKGFKEVVADPAVRKSFIEKAVRPILQAAATHPGIFAWDIINEPEWLVRHEDGGDPNKELSDGPVSLSELRAYIKDMAAEVHAKAKQPVSVGSACLKWSGAQYDFYSGLGLDFFDVHYYDWMTPWFDVTRTPKESLKLSPEYQQKPMIIGECMDKPEIRYTGPNKPADHFRFLQAILKMGYAGYLPWAWYEKPDFRCDEAIEPHFNRALKELALPGQGAALSGLALKGAASDASGLESLGSVEVVHRMGLGWNLGNTLEACGDWIKGQDVKSFETAWGSPETTPEMIDKIKASGFKSVRIPVAWSNLIAADYTVNPRLMARVKQITDYVLKDGMIAVVNIHWDGGWWKNFPAEPEKSMKRYTRIWSQIAEQFKDYPGTLIFESLNEEGCFNDVWNRYGSSDPEKRAKAYGILNNINQTFVDLVRSSGGLNGKRHLLIAGYATDIDLTVDSNFKMPKDPAGHEIVSVHYYTPYTFAGLEKDESWGKMRPTWGTPEDVKELTSNMEKLKMRFLSQGIPVIVGEYGATTKKEPESVRRYLLSVAEVAYRLGMCPMLWDANAHFDRRTLRFNDPALLKGFQRIMDVKRD